jgi:hypothetical protein
MYRYFVKIMTKSVCLKLYKISVKPVANYMNFQT